MTTVIKDTAKVTSRIMFHNLDLQAASSHRLKMEMVSVVLTREDGFVMAILFGIGVVVVLLLPVTIKGDMYIYQVKISAWLQLMMRMFVVRFVFSSTTDSLHVT